MEIINLKVDRIIIHQIFEQDEDGKKVKPQKGTTFIKFDASASETFRSRVVDALGEGGSSIEMEVIDQGPDETPAILDRMIGEPDDNFIESSYELAKRLTNAQTSRIIPGGILVVFSGTFSANPPRKMIGLIKAETHSAYEVFEDPSTSEISLKYVEEVLLTPSSRLYKTAGFFEKKKASKTDNLNSRWIPVVSDFQISRGEGRGAAKYFYSTFLGLEHLKTSARTTRRFYEATVGFIGELDIEEEQKSDLITALTTYLKVDTSSTINPNEFAKSYFDTSTQDAFKEVMVQAEVPTTAFTKDVTEIQKKLKTRKLRFKKNITITGSSDAFENLVEIETIEPDPEELQDEGKKWTRVTIKDEIKNQE